MKAIAGVYVCQTLHIIYYTKCSEVNTVSYNLYIHEN